MLTHQQALIARVMLLSDKTIKHARTLGTALLLSDDPPTCLARSNAAELLAEYDAHYITVEKVEFERLQAVERKISAFLHGTTYSVPGSTNVCSFGDEVWSAFEAFEVKS